MPNVPATVRKMGYSEISRKSGLTLGYISLLFRGLRGARMGTLERIAKVLEVPTEDLLKFLLQVQQQRKLKSDPAAA